MEDRPALEIEITPEMISRAALVMATYNLDGGTWNECAKRTLEEALEAGGYLTEM